MNNYLVTEQQLQFIMNSLLECQGKYVIGAVDLIRSLKPFKEENKE